MASAWGKSWGGAFGVAWGNVGQVQPPVVNPPMGGSGGWPFVYPKYPNSSHLGRRRSRHAREAEWLLMQRL